MSKILIESKAYTKIMLHLIKYTSNDCYGLLLGNNNKVNDILPLSHDKIFAPNFELAVKMIEDLYSNDNDLNIIGFYENLIINQNKTEGEISNLSYHICDLILNKKKVLPIFFEIYSKDIPDEKSGKRKDEIEFKIFNYNEKGTFDYIENYKETEEDFKKIKNLVVKNLQNDLIDFDNYLEDPNLDFRNLFIK